MKDIQRAQNDIMAGAHHAVPMTPSQEPDDAERWRMLNELEEAELYQTEEDTTFDDDDDAWAELFNGKEDDPFADFDEFADLDEDTEEALDQLDEDEWDEYEDDYDEDWDEYEDDYDEDWDEYEADSIGDYEAE